MIRKGLIAEPSRIKGMGGLYVVYGNSSLSESIGYRGVSHLVEHLLCKSYASMEAELEANGITANAYTSDNEVVFFFTGLDESIERYQYRLLDLINYVPTIEEFETEREIVIQEYNNTISSKNFIYSNIMRKYFDYYGPIGSIEDLEGLTYESLISFIEDRFRKPISIIRIGDSISINDCVLLVEYGEGIVGNGLVSCDKPENVIRSSVFPDSKLICDWQVVEGLTYQELDIINRMWSSGLGSPMYSIIREKHGLSYGLGHYISNLGGMFINHLSIMCNPKSEDLVRILLEEMFRDWEEHLTESRFNDIIGSLKSSCKISELTEYDNIDRFIGNDYISVEYLESISWEYIRGVISKYMKTDWNKASISSTIEI